MGSKNLFIYRYTNRANLDGALAFDGRDGRVDVLGHHIAPVEEAAGHVFTVPGVAFYHLVGGVEAGICYFGDAHLFVVGFFGADDGGIGDQREVDAGVGH